MQHDDPPKRLSLAEKRALAAPLVLGSEYRENSDPPAPGVLVLGNAEADRARKQLISLRVDPEVLDFFKAQGPGYQTRMNAVLEAFVKASKSVKTP